MRKLSSISGKPGIVFGAIAVAIILVIFSFFGFRMQVNSYISGDMRSQVEAIQKNSSLLIQTEMNYLKRLNASAAQMVNRAELQTDKDILQTLQDYADSSHVVRAIFITLDGHAYTNYAGYLGQSEANTSIDGINISEITEPVFSQPYYAEDLDEVIFGVIAPTTMAKKQGILISSYNIKAFSNLLDSQSGNDNPEIGIINGNGEVVYGKSADEFKLNIFDSLRKVKFKESSVDAMQANFKNGASGFSIYGVNGVERYCSYAPIGLNNWYVVVMVKEDVLRSKLADLEKYGFQLTVELVVIMLGLLIVIMAARLREQNKIRTILERAAMLDGLTGIYNRKAVEETIEKALHTAGDATSAAMLVIDVDNFKQINDCMGHLFGDIVLKECADRLNSMFGKEGVVGRIGGDEFIVFLYECPDLAQIEKKISRFIHDFYILTDAGEKQKVSVSAGIAQADAKANTFLMLYQQADNALYRAKQTGKERISR